MSAINKLSLFISMLVIALQAWMMGPVIAHDIGRWIDNYNYEVQADEWAKAYGACVITLPQKDTTQSNVSGYWTPILYWHGCAPTAEGSKP